MTPRAPLSPFRRDGDGWILSLHVQPGALREGVLGRHGDAPKGAVKGQPQEGRATETLRKFLAHLLGISPAAISIVSGHTSRRKTVRVVCVSAAAVAKLAAHLLPAARGAK